MNTILIRIVLLLGLCSLGGCSYFWQATAAPGTRDGVSSSLVDYLYPKGEVPPPRSETIPRLDLPLRAGIAFVPGTNRSDSVLSEAKKNELLGKVRDAFKTRDYVQHIEVIPETYLRSSKGFEGMQQVARLYGVDVMALVSYDQVTVSDDTRASLLYWTIVGAYVVKATENEVQTFVDTAVFDVPTRTLLFRAPGTDTRERRSTAVESMETMREQQIDSFAAAMDQMTLNLAGELDVFEDRLKSEPQLAEVKWDESRSGGMAGLGFVSIFALLVVALARQARRRGADRG